METRQKGLQSNSGPVLICFRLLASRRSDLVARENSYIGELLTARTAVKNNNFSKKTCRLFHLFYHDNSYSIAKSKKTFLRGHNFEDNEFEQAEGGIWWGLFACLT